MKIYDLIAFDLDGTLTDPASGLVKSFAYALDRMGIDYGDRSSLVQFIGPPLYSEWKRLYRLSDEEADRALRTFREYFAEYGWWDNRLYDGIPEMLSALRAAGKTLLVATSKPEHFAKDILKLFHIDVYFDFVAGALTEKIRETKAEVLSYALDAFPDIPRERCILVGDRRYDAEGAALCGIDSLGVLYGHGSREELLSSGFTALAETVGDVARLLV